MKRLTVLLIAIGVCAPQVDAADGWKVGVAKTIITPTGPVWMSGYDRTRPGDGKYQDLWAKALAVEDAGGRRALLITMDLVGIDRPTSQRVCEQLAARHKLDRAQIALNVSHTHCGPVVGRNLDGLYALDDAEWERIDEYTRLLIDKLVALGGEAIDHLEPGAIAWGQGYSTIAVNRRMNREDDIAKVREAGALKGPSDYDLPVLTVRDPAGKLLAVVFGYACHPTVLNAEYQWSGDYAGFAQAALEEAHPGASAMFWAGCGGDQAPRPKGTMELTEAYGRRLAGSVEEVLAGQLRPLRPELVTRYEETSLRLAKTPTREELQTSTASKNEFVARLARRLLADLDQGKPLREAYPYPIQVWQLDDLRWIFLGGEVVVDYALRLKRELGPATWVAGYSNDVMAYIPSLRVLREGGYEGANAQVYYSFPTPWSEEIEEQIVKAIHQLCPAEPQKSPPVGFTPLFSGRDLAGWRGQKTIDPRRFAGISEEERARILANDVAELTRHWTADMGELINDGDGPFATTTRDYGDVELKIDWKLLSPGGGGIALRGTPEIALRDDSPHDSGPGGAAGKGSGGLLNNDLDASGREAPGQQPTVRADRPLGEWNHFRVLQTGEQTSVWLNEKLIVDHAIWQNVFDRPTPELPYGPDWDPLRKKIHAMGNRASPLFAQGPIQLGTHGSRVCWRNVFVREIPFEEANGILARSGEEGFVSVFNGRDLAGWSGAVASYEVSDGAIVCKPGQGGILYTEQEYGDFVARVEYKLSPAGNNGLAIRYPGSGRVAFDGFCEVQVLDDDHPKHAASDARQFNGSAYGIVPAHRGYLRPTGDWNFQEVTAIGSKIKVELNGSIILDADLSQVKEFMDDEPHPGMELRRGHFGFAGHRDPVQFRNVRIKSLDAQER